MSTTIIVLLAYLVPLITVYIVQPSVAKVALAKNFIAEPEERFAGIPLLSLGGVSMFIGINLSVSLLCTRVGFLSMHAVIAALIVLLFSGFIIDTSLAVRYFRFSVKLLAAILVVFRFHEGAFQLLPNLPVWTNILLQIGFLVGFMLLYHRLTTYKKTLLLLLAIANALAFGVIFWPNQHEFHWSLLAFSLAGSLSGIMTYARYAHRLNKPLPLIGHTGIYFTALLLGTLWLTFFRVHPIF
ncbi:hypothetical protein [Mangrovibacterium sp.]|uniref:hypothetical protein n=1 Tax=Mangrovibacterium sp. TaxID=1961364 RepID=UPI00356B3E61